MTGVTRSTAGRSGALRAEPASPPQAEPPAANAGFDPSRSLFSQVVKSLRERPNEWQQQLCNLVHQPTGVSVWIGNHTYGVDITDRAFGVNLWGGVTTLSSFGLSPRHHILYRAARRCLEAKRGEA